jgi:hypothetical protein
MSASEWESWGSYQGIFPNPELPIRIIISQPQCGVTLHLGFPHNT